MPGNGVFSDRIGGNVWDLVDLARKDRLYDTEHWAEPHFEEALKALGRDKGGMILAGDAELEESGV